MTTDPFLSQRIGGVNNGNFGVDGSSLFISFLGSTSSATADAFRLSFKYDGSANFYLSNTATGWSLNGTTATGAPSTLNTPTLFVLRFDFAAGATDSISLWVNPALGTPLGSPNAMVSNIDFPGLANFQTRAAVANAMTFDELRDRHHPRRRHSLHRAYCRNWFGNIPQRQRSRRRWFSRPAHPRG